MDLINRRRRSFEGSKNSHLPIFPCAWRAINGNRACVYRGTRWLVELNNHKPWWIMQNKELGGRQADSQFIVNHFTRNCHSTLAYNRWHSFTQIMLRQFAADQRDQHQRVLCIYGLSLWLFVCLFELEVVRFAAVTYGAPGTVAFELF